jgi:hypothetical protein
MLPGVYFQGFHGFVVFGVVAAAVLLVATRAAVALCVRRSTTLRKTLQTQSAARRSFLVLAVVWSAALVYGELVVHAVHACAFPRVEGFPDEQFNVFVLADPQLVDEFAYPHLPSWAHAWVAYLCDVQLRRSWKAQISVARPHLAVILGDLFWGPFEFTDEATWKLGVRRLNRVFGSTSDENTFRPSVPTMAVCGNHDIGMYRCNVPLKLKELWLKTFGPFHWEYRTPFNVTLIGVSNPLLQDDQCAKNSKDESIAWLEKHQKEWASAGNRILFVHIPLEAHPARDTGQCDEAGRGRRAGYRLTRGGGMGYENVLRGDLTSMLLEKTRPSLVFSGDAHDLCEVRVSSTGTWDITLPSFSWMEGTFHTGYVLLSIGSNGIVTNKVCWQPQQISIYLFYAGLGAMTVIFIVLSTFYNAISERTWNPFVIWFRIARLFLEVAGFAVTVFLLLLAFY